MHTDPPYEKIPDSIESVDYGFSAFRAIKQPGWTWRKSLVCAIHFAFYPLIYWLLFEADMQALGVGTGDRGRNVLVFVLNLLWLIDYTIKCCCIMERQFHLVEVFFVIPVICPLWLFTFAYCARKNASPVGGIDLLASLLVVVGVYLNFWPEFVRQTWKHLPQNSGRLYTGHLFAYVRNANYLGDLLWETGLAMATGVWIAAWVPVVSLLGFVVGAIPEKESYLAKHYEEEWPAYQEKTVRLIPFLY
jgi:protein-S-isoprenylcysteine O-methyltransferase Ste14